MMLYLLETLFYLTETLHCNFCSNVDEFSSEFIHISSVKCRHNQEIVLLLEVIGKSCS